ncbi:hypothetical protein HWV62_37861 [Athelia sp. TMB]|nr:hypothetical protein HWV62_37861 [Athelia sp. TMB]
MVPLLAPTPLVISLLRDLAAVGYLSAAVFTVLAWDLLICLSDDFKVARISGFSPSIVAYFLSRIGTLLLSILALVLQNGPIMNCTTFTNISKATSIIGGAATSFLFLVRVRAVYMNSRPITLFFGAFWLGIVATSTLVVISGKLNRATFSDRCTLSSVKVLESVSLWVKAAFDTAVFIAITTRIVSYSTTGRAPHVSKWQAFRAARLPRIYRDLLHGGQLFYFVTIGVTLLGASAVLLPATSVYRVALTLPAVAIESIMACRVFRRIALSARKAEEGSYGPETTDSMVMTTLVPNVQDSQVELEV